MGMDSGLDEKRPSGSYFALIYRKSSQEGAELCLWRAWSEWQHAISRDLGKTLARHELLTLLCAEPQAKGSVPYLPSQARRRSSAAFVAFQAGAASQQEAHTWDSQAALRP